MRSSTRLVVSLCLLALVSLATAAASFGEGDETTPAVATKAGENNTLVLPYFRATLTDPNGEATLYAVRNNGASPVTVRFSYYGASGGSAALVEEEVLAAHAVRSVNLQLVSGLPSNGSGVSTGYLIVEALDDSLAAGTLSGDYFRVSPSNDSANGNPLLPGAATDCKRWSHRFFNGGGFNGGSKIAFLVLDRPSAGPVVIGNVYNEAGDLITMVPLESNRNAFEVSDADLQLPVSFGSIDWFFQGGAHGTVTTTFTANDRFSAGVDAACVDGVGTGPAPEPNATVFELPGTFLTCNRCGNWQYDMPIPGGRRNFSKVIVDFDVFIAGWDPNRVNGFHCIFWLNNGTQWQDMMGYLNSRGTQNRVVFQTNGPLGNPIGVERYRSPGIEVGQTYHVHYEYDTINKTVSYQILTTSGELRVGDVIALPANVGPLSTSYTFIQFGSQPGGAVESLTERWRWSNFRAQFVP